MDTSIKATAAALARPLTLPPPAPPPTDEDNLFGQTADFPGIGSQAASAFEPHPPPEAAVAGAAAAPAAASTTEAGPADGGGGRHLVLAVDDSDASERAAMWAVANLYRPGDICHLMHIIPAMPYRWGASPYRWARSASRQGGIEAQLQGRVVRA